MKPQLCPRCLDSVERLYKPQCKFSKLVASETHTCEDCGVFILSDSVHPDICKRCRDKIHPLFDK